MLLRSRGGQLSALSVHCISRCRPLPLPCLRRLNSTNQAPPGHEQQEQKSEDSKQQAPKGSYTRAFVPLLAGIPFGWLVHSLLEDKGQSSNIARPTDFVKYQLVDRQAVSSTSSIFTLKPLTSSSIGLGDPQYNRAITSVQFKQPQLQIARSYTLLPNIQGQDADELRFLIRKEQNGEVSGYLHRLAIGEEIEVRGPSVDWVLPDQVHAVAFLAGGTGIAPAVQVADKVAGEAGMHLFWANRRREDCAGGVSDAALSETSTGWNLAKWWNSSAWTTEGQGEPEMSSSERSATVLLLEDLKARASKSGSDVANLRVNYFVDEEGTYIRPDSVSKLVRSLSQREDGSHKERLLFVSGPEGFVNYWAGPKQWANGRETQGPLGGVLSTLDLRGWKVVKL